MKAVTVRAHNLDELRRAIRKAGDEGLKKALKASNKSAAEIVVRAALPKVPVRSGALKRSVRSLASQKSGRVAAGNARAPHAAAIHFGRKVGNVGRPPGNHPGPNPIAGRMFLWDAANDKAPEVEKQYLEDINNLFDAVRRTN